MTCTQTHRILGKLLYLGLKHIRADRCCITAVECFGWKELWVQLNVNVLLTAKYSRVIKKSFRNFCHHRDQDSQDSNKRTLQRVWSHDKILRKINYASIVLHVTKHSRNLIMVWIAMSKLSKFWLAELYFSSKWSAVFKVNAVTCSYDTAYLNSW